MADPKLCIVDDCGKPAPCGRYCSMHAARLSRGGSLEPRHSKRSIDDLLSGNTQFGDWTILGEGAPYQRPTNDGSAHPDGVQRTAKCRCVCGTERMVPIHILKRKGTSHCGCKMPAITAAAKTTHGMSYTAEHRAWCKMKERCGNPNSKDWPDYGGRGIRVYEGWISSFEAFFGHIGPKPDASFSIDRIDVDGNYEPGNVRWADKWTQARNKRPKRR